VALDTNLIELLARFLERRSSLMQQKWNGNKVEGP